jgi:hypothetical protein
LTHKQKISAGHLLFALRTGERMLSRCDSAGMDYAIGLARNARLEVMTNGGGQFNRGVNVMQPAPPFRTQENLRLSI